MDKFTFKRSWYEAIKDLPEGIRKDIYDCIVRYAFGEDVPELRSMARVAFQFIKGDMDSSKKFRALVNKRWNSYDTKDDSRMIRAEYGSNAEKEEVPKEKVIPKEIPEEEKRKEKDIDKSISKKKDPREEFVENLPDDWRGVVSTWLRYKAARKEYYKTVQTLQVFYKNLQEYSSHNVSIAQKVVEQSIGNNWQGIFPLRNQSYSSAPKSTFVSLPTDYEADSKIGFQV